MPVFMVEAYVGKSIESIISQSYTNWELFAVVDGSPDKSGEVCERYAKTDDRIKVIHKENGGAPSARNTGIDLADGDYFFFMDSDDWVESNMLEDMVALAEENDAQLVIAGFIIDTYYNKNKKFTQYQVMPSRVFKDQNEFRLNAHRLLDKNLLYTPWNKLFSRKYIIDNKLYFPNTFWDDFPFNLSVVKDISRVVLTEKTYYHFIRQRADSETSKYRSDMYSKREEEARWLIDLYDYWQLSSPDIDEFLARRYIERIVGCIENVTNKNCSLSKNERKAEIKKMISAEYAKWAVKTACPNSKYMKLMLLPIKWNNTPLTYLEGKVISFVRQSNVKTFAKLKAGR